MDENKTLFTLDDIETFVFHNEWITEGIAKLPPEMQAKIVLDGLRVGIGLEPYFTDQGDVAVDALVEILSNKVVNSRGAYLNKLNEGKANSGRKKRFSDMDIYTLANQGKTVQEITQILGCSESTVRHSAGYQNRKNEGFIG